MIERESQIETRNTLIPVRMNVTKLKMCYRVKMYINTVKRERNPPTYYWMRTPLFLSIYESRISDGRGCFGQKGSGSEGREILARSA